MEKQPSSSGSKLERQDSIEEPKTLTAEQLDALREAAMEVIAIHGEEKATRIFLTKAGKKPMTIPESKLVSGKQASWFLENKQALDLACVSSR